MSVAAMRLAHTYYSIWTMAQTDFVDQYLVNAVDIDC